MSDLQVVPRNVLARAIAKAYREYAAIPGAIPGDCWAEVEALADYLADTDEEATK